MKSVKTCTPRADGYHRIDLGRVVHLALAKAVANVQQYGHHNRSSGFAFKHHFTGWAGSAVGLHGASYLVILINVIISVIWLLRKILPTGRYTV